MAGAVALAVVLLFLPVLSYPFLNWDDQEVFVRNTALHAPGLLRWAFTTTAIEHYQPLAWLTWGVLDRASALTPAAAHALNASLHAACAMLVCLLAYRLIGNLYACVFAALLFAVHPLRVEVVAWASAMPYSLALLFALLSVLAFLNARERRWMIGFSIALYAMSLLARPIAIGLPAVLYFVAALKGPPYDRLASAALKGPPHERPTAAITDGRGRGAALSEPPSPATVAVLVAGLFAIIAAFFESQARAAGTTGVTLGARLTLALTAPFRYAWRTIAPFGLTPVDPLALTPRADVTLIAASGAALALISWAAWRWRHRYPYLALAWVSYLVLLLPAAGVLPSGLQATADRYTYLPSVPLAIAAAGAFGIAGAPQSIVRPLRVTAAILIAALAWLSYQQTRYWRDSLTLWTRAIEIDPDNDIALYNLATVLAADGRRDEALARYEEVLKLVPDQSDARRNRDLLLAAQLEEQANRLAASGNLGAAIRMYRRALGLDPARTHAQAALGIALVESGRTTEALPPLREAVSQGATDPAVPNALAFVLMKEGRTREACDALEAARAKFPGDVNVARNLEGLKCAPR